MSEVIVTDPVTGGKKGQKQARFDLIPAKPLEHLALVYGKGSEKYEDRNWEKGYRWGLSYGAMQRHLWAFWGGEYLDSESGLPHLAHAMWHCMTLMQFEEERLGTDDRSAAAREKAGRDLSRDEAYGRMDRQAGEIFRGAVTPLFLQRRGDRPGTHGQPHEWKSACVLSPRCEPV